MQDCLITKRAKIVLGMKTLAVRRSSGVVMLLSSAVLESFKRGEIHRCLPNANVLELRFEGEFGGADISKHLEFLVLALNSVILDAFFYNFPSGFMLLLSKRQQHCLLWWFSIPRFARK